MRLSYLVFLFAFLALVTAVSKPKIRRDKRAEQFIVRRGRKAEQLIYPTKTISQQFIPMATTTATPTARTTSSQTSTANIGRIEVPDNGQARVFTTPTRSMTPSRTLPTQTRAQSNTIPPTNLTPN